MICDESRSVGAAFLGLWPNGLSLPPVRISHLHTPLEEMGPDGVTGNVEAFANSSQRQALFIELDCHVDLLVGELAKASLHVVALEYVADSLSADTKTSSQFVDGGPGLVRGDELLSLVALDLLGSSGSGTPLALYGWAGGVW